MVPIRYTESMKRAKKHLLPTIAKLYASTRRADRAMTDALAAVSASEKRIQKREQAHAKTKESLDQLLAAFDVDRHRGEVMAFPPVGKELF